MSLSKLFERISYIFVRFSSLYPFITIDDELSATKLYIYYWKLEKYRGGRGKVVYGCCTGLFCAWIRLSRAYYYYYYYEWCFLCVCVHIYTL